LILSYFNPGRSNVASPIRAAKMFFGSALTGLRLQTPEILRPPGDSLRVYRILVEAMGHQTSLDLTCRVEVDTPDAGVASNLFASLSL
jgi:hypothetical protein